MEVFTLDLATIPAGRSDVVVEARPDQIGLDPTSWGESVRCVLTVELSGDQVTIRGPIEAEAHLDCARCLVPVKFAMRVPLEVFAERGGGRRSAHEAELERDNYMKFHDGRRLDLREDAREALLLEVPMAPTCRPDCRGLCVRCGGDLNQGPCGCGPRAD